MKCIIINGSPSKKYPWGGKMITGFTAQLVEEVKKEMQRLGQVDFEEIRLDEVALPFCEGCYACFNKGEEHCPHSALYQSMMQKIKDADCLIFTSPVYALNVSALVKGFFDHGAYNFHRPRFFTKKALVVSSTAGGMAKKVCVYMRDMFKHWGFNRVYKLPAVRQGAAEPTDKMIAASQKVARRFYRDVASKKLYAPTIKRIFFYQLWRNLSRNDIYGADYAYWKESGLIDHEFSPEVKMGFFKRIIAKLINGMLRKAFGKGEK